MIAASAYVLVAAGFSIAPIRNAVAQARLPSPPPPRAASRVEPEAPDTPTVKIAKAAGKQAVIIFGPPALALWFGWDVWFAIVGFFPPRGAKD